jgi:hypothetical protein
MKHGLFMALLVAALVFGAVTLGRDTPRLAQEVSSATSEEASIHAYGDSNRTCAEWTDSCRTCLRPESGEPHCSNVGISCQPKAITCTRRVEEKREDKK